MPQAFLVQKTYNVRSSATIPDNTIGENGDVGRDDSGNVYVKVNGTWELYSNVTGGYTGPITVENSAGSVTRSLNAVNGVVNLAATDAIVANGSSLVLENHSGTVSSGNAGLNSPAVANVAAGVVSSVQAGA
jgi:hypothetical protein